MIRMTTLTNLHSSDLATLFPSLAHVEPDGQAWRVDVSGIVYRLGSLTLGRRLMLGVLRRAMRVAANELDCDIFRERVQGFLIEAGTGKNLAIRLGDEVHPLSGRTSRSGNFEEELRLPVERLHQLERDAGPTSAIPVSLVDADGEDFGAASHVHFVPRRGVTIVSDIDDTVKETHVHQRHTMLVNTFLREFVPVPGIAELYRRWEQAGAVFHYVSSSPWQLFTPLAKHFAEVGLPNGSFHLRAFRLRDHMLRRIFFGRRPVKAVVIRNLMLRYPQRRFVLVGDSGEHDPEIYGALARKFPQQVAAIYIRQVPGQSHAPFRWQRAFRKLDLSLWKLFDDPAELDADFSAIEPLATV
jgi:hypothetical protein